MFAIQQHEMPSTRPIIDVVAGSKRPLSPVPSPSSPKKVKVKYSCEDSESFEDDNEVDLRELHGWGRKTWQNAGANNLITNRNLSQTFRHASDDEDVKYDPAYFDEQCQGQQVQEAIKDNPHAMEESTHPLRLESPSSSPVSPCRSPESPSRYASSRSHRRRGFRPSHRMGEYRTRSTPPPPAPQMELLTSPPGATPPPLFFSSPRSDQLVNIPGTVHQQGLRSTLSLGGNELAYLNNIVPSPSDDVFNTEPSQEHSLSGLVKKKRDGDHTLKHVRNPAKGPISKWTVVAKREQEELVGYPCDDFKFRTEKHDVLGTWDEMGNIKDIDGNIIH